MLDKIANTWGMRIPMVAAPELPEGGKEMAHQKEDWDELSASFGMVTVRLSVGRGAASKLALADWILKEARVPKWQSGRSASETMSQQLSFTSRRHPTS